MQVRIAPASQTGPPQTETFNSGKSQSPFAARGPSDTLAESFESPPIAMSLPDSPVATGRIFRLAALLALLAALTPAGFFFADMPLARWAFAKGLPGDLKHVVQFAETFAHGSGVFLIILAAIALDQRSWRVLPRLAIGAYGAGLLADILKIVLARRRPHAYAADVMNVDAGDTFLGFFAWRNAQTWQEALSHEIQSFPSGHAATAAGLACALGRLYPRAAWFFAALTVLACFQRIASEAHYLSDVLAGAAVGVAFNLLLELPRVRHWLSGFEHTEPA
jgi:membrane-associated phospholipid phosphatase